MAVIYERRGRGADIAEFGLNLYSGCAIGCRYCYSFGSTVRRGTNGLAVRSRARIFCLC